MAPQADVRQSPRNGSVIASLAWTKPSSIHMTMDARKDISRHSICTVRRSSQTLKHPRLIVTLNSPVRIFASNIKSCRLPFDIIHIVARLGPRSSRTLRVQTMLCEEHCTRGRSRLHADNFDLQLNLEILLNSATSCCDLQQCC